MSVSEKFFLGDPSSTQLDFDRSIVLPPDTATVLMARIGKRLLEASRIAHRIYDSEDSASLNRAVDLGSGSCVIGATVLDKVDTLISVDNDSRALNYGRQNIERIAEGLRRAVNLSFIEGSWHDASVWKALPESGLFISNPPYLVDGESIRSGYEHTPPGHLYVDTAEDLMATYTQILTESLKKLPMWGNIVLRLPKNNKEVPNWPQALVNNSIEDFKALEDSSFMVRSEYEEAFGDRPLHFLYIQRLPNEYGFLETSGDPNIINVLQGKEAPLIEFAPNNSRRRLTMVSENR